MMLINENVQKHLLSRDDAQSPNMVINSNIEISLKDLG